MTRLLLALACVALLACDAPQCVTDTECGCTLDCLDPADELTPDELTPDVGSFLPPVQKGN